MMLMCEFDTACNMLHCLVGTHWGGLSAALLIAVDCCLTSCHAAPSRCGHTPVSTCNPFHVVPKAGLGCRQQVGADLKPARAVWTVEHTVLPFQCISRTPTVICIVVAEAKSNAVGLVCLLAGSRQEKQKNASHTVWHIRAAVTPCQSTVLSS